jgi:uncharacterized protein (DUF849 family)
MGGPNGRLGGAVAARARRFARPVQLKKARKATMATIGLCMIVKDEATIIARCIKSALPLVDFVLIVDTGSTDGTQEVIRSCLREAGMPGEVIDEPWQDFAYNRTFALTKLREHRNIDYALINDADDQIVLDDGFDAAAFKDGMAADLYEVEIRHGSIRYHRPQILSNTLSFSYRGVLHEFVEAPPEAHSRATAAGFHILFGGDGARSQDPAKFVRDAATLERAVEREQNPFLISRYTFYLAQSYRDAGETEKALVTYLKRPALGFWDQEIFISLLNAARLKEQLGHPEQEILDAYMRASDAAPTRAEALHGASRFCRAKSRFEEGYEFARRGVQLSIPAGALFVEPWIYEYGLLDEVAVNAYWAERYEDALEACERLLHEDKLPADTRPRVTENAQYAAEKVTLQHSQSASIAEPAAGTGWPRQPRLAARPVRCRLRSQTTTKRGNQRVSKVIISCAVTGSIHTPSMSPYLPITPEDIAAQSIAAAEAGAAIIHLHARNPETGEPTPDPAVFMRFLPIIKQSTDAVVNITTGGGLGMTLQDRLAAPVRASPELCSLNMGSMNFNISRAADRITEWKYAWEQPYLARTDDHIFRNTFKDIAHIVAVMGSGHGTRFEFECYDIGHLYNLAYMVDQKVVEPPLFVQSIFGILGGIGADPRNLMFMRDTADRLFGHDYVWSVLAAGRHQLAFTTQAGILGGNVRVGLEDSLFIGKGKLATSNAEQVTKIRRILEDLSLEIATPAEARTLLKLKGGDRVKF